MRLSLVIAAASTMALAAPALAQDAGSPGAVGTGGGLTGSNTGTGPAWGYGGPGDYGNGYYGPAPVYGPGPGYYGPGNGVVIYDERERGPMFEGRAAAPDEDLADPNPRTVRGDQNGQDLVR